LAGRARPRWQLSKPNKSRRSTSFSSPETKGPVKDVRTAFEIACRAAGIKNLRIHDYRHAFATTLSVNGVEVPTISRLLGQSSNDYGSVGRRFESSQAYQLFPIQWLDILR